MQCKLKHGELFCGPGGMALGAKNSSITAKKIKYTIDTIWAIDNDTEACKTFKRNVAYQNSIITNRYYPFLYTANNSVLCFIKKLIVL